MLENIKDKIWVAWIMLVFGVIGLIDSIYLTSEHYSDTVIPCNIGECETVLTSSYSEIMGIPTSALGVAFYGFIVFSLLAFISLRDKRIMLLTSLATVTGLLTSIGLVYIQLFVLHAICQWCMLSATTSTFLFIFGMYWLFGGRKLENKVEEKEDDEEEEE